MTGLGVCFALNVELWHSQVPMETYRAQITSVDTTVLQTW
jgi:hypothetical protein